MYISWDKIIDEDEVFAILNNEVHVFLAYGHYSSVPCWNVQHRLQLFSLVSPRKMKRSWLYILNPRFFLRKVSL